MSYKIKCEAWTNQAKLEMSGDIYDNGEISMFMSAYGEDYPNGIERQTTNSYETVINFYRQAYEKVLFSDDIELTEEIDDNLANLQYPKGMFFAVYNSDETKNPAIRCFLQALTGKWFQLIVKSDSQHSLIKSSPDDMKLIFYSAVQSGRFVDAI
ncbi:MAG: hypothetical protein LBT99_03505 [Bifidobacteriaceae bacterium]|jgi:hypothetical protein|nr:hypothetical protein [Bifidobacteriaceae bacterium]